MIPLLIVLGTLYELPDPTGIVAPDAQQAKRIDVALAALRTATGDELDVAVRELALVGEVALPAIVARLNEAAGGERLLLLAAVRRMPRAAPLWTQARGDPHPAVRAYAAGPPRREPEDLRLLARRYLDVLALAEKKLRDEADQDFKEGRPDWLSENDEALRKRMRDRKLADAVQRRRNRAAQRLALVGGRALRAGKLAPDLTDPVFVAYVGLLREESSAFFHAVTALSALGPKVVPALETLLTRSNHEVRKILRLLFAVAPDRVAAVYARFDTYREDAQRALVMLAPTHLEGGNLLVFLEKAALTEHGTVRSAALDGLLALAAPAGRVPARKLLDPELYGAADFKRASRLLGRAGEFVALEQFATIDVPDDDTAVSAALRSLKRECRAALRKQDSPTLAEVAARLVTSEKRDLRLLGVDLMCDREKLLEVLRTESDEHIAGAAATRALDRFGGDVARAVIDALAARDLAVPWSIMHKLRDAGQIDLLVELAAGEQRRHAFGALADLETIDKKHEAALLAIHEKWPSTRALTALLPLGTAEVGKRFRAAGETALPILVGRAEQNGTIGFEFPLRSFLKDADATRLKDLARIAESLPSLEGPFYYDLMKAWDALPAGERMTEGGLDSGAAEQKVKLLHAMTRSKDRESARLFFDDLLAGRVKEDSLVLGILKAAAKHLDAEQLARLVPVVRARAKEEYADAEKVAPPFNRFRYRLLRGSINALAWGKVEAALPDLCDFFLDPNLHSPAYDWKQENRMPWWSLEALRHFPADKVGPAFRAALKRAEVDGRLARMHPGRMFWAVKVSRQGYFVNSGRARGRWMPEVSLALCEVLERLPWEGDVTYERGLALGGLRRYAEAAAVMRTEAERRRAQGYAAEDGYWIPGRLFARAHLYDALDAKNKKAMAAVLDDIAHEPFLLYIAAFHLLHTLPDIELAERAAAQSVRATGALYHLCRTWLAGVYVEQKKPTAAIELIDPLGRLPVKRNATDRWHLLFLARAHLQLGDTLNARHALERAVDEDRRILPYAKGLPEFQQFADVFKEVEIDFLNRLFDTGY